MSGPASISMRPALAELPALPLHQRPKPITVKASPGEIAKVTTGQSLTPPSTPAKPEINGTPTSAYGAGTGQVDIKRRRRLSLDFSGLAEQDQANEEQERGLKLCHKKYELHQELGHGVWSNVYRATELFETTMRSDTLPLSPPISPTNGCSSKGILAIKKPSRRDAHKILEDEARTLTYLHSHKGASSYLVPFHGFDIAQHSIILGAVPMTLETHAKLAKKRPLSTKTMFDPVIGAEDWARLAENLISGLAFVHGWGCIHGDIKPANILLRVDEDEKLTPFYCDFSSSRTVTSTTIANDIEEVSAVTADYTSPELLESLHKRNNDRAVVTFASDVFALAVTLLYAATGESPYACARVDFQKLSMAKEGKPLEYARRGEQASRIMEGRAVEKALRGSLAKDPKTRLKVEEWKPEIQSVVNGWMAKGWSRG